MGIKQFFTKQAAKYATRNLPEDQKEMIQKLVEVNPELFEKIAKETQELVKSGKPEMYASFEVMKKYQKELQDVAAKAGLQQVIKR
jgi:NTP pyrophosphatase (non-canonical NTP hydrolase)